ncbi:MAG: hypothetical protein J7K34_06500 [Flavobacteriaceae bacterium]|nr:hypothetical protein [Flavobacteriaceae bacterium]
MKVYKFGGTSVKDADGVRNLKKVLQTIGYSDTVLVISAMGKMTNAFERLVVAHLLDDGEGVEEFTQYEIIKDFHINMINNLFDDSNHPIFEEVENLLDNFNNFDSLVQDLNVRYKVLYNKNLTLYTIRHFTDEAIREIEKGKKVLIKQLSRETAQIVVQN